MSNATAVPQLPRVAVYDMDVGAYAGIFYGPSAEDDAYRLIDEAPGNHERFDVSTSDDRCGSCGEMFSREARQSTERGWVCPVCGGDPKATP